MTRLRDNKKRAKLVLDDGTVFNGYSFGHECSTLGEVVFNTAMTGYPESMTDPSYEGQILVMTYPLIGNYGVPTCDAGTDGIPFRMESESIHIKALVVADYSDVHSHWESEESLSAWLKRNHIPAITGVDTRELTKRLREKGSMMGRIVLEDTSAETEEFNYGSVNFVKQVSCDSPIVYGEHGNKKKVVLVDCGVKANIIRCLTKRNVEVMRVPWDYDFTTIDYDGLFLSNGPGNPDTCSATVEHIRKAMQTSDKPIFGICLGNQLLAKAAGAKVYKLKYGHRSHNQPVRLTGTNRCFITSQNHGYAVDQDSLPDDWEPMFCNMNDGSNEGIRHKTKPWFSVQFHPEAASGPTDTEFLFDEFIKLL